MSADPVLATTSLLASQYRLGAGSSVVSGLFGKDADKPFSGLSVLQSGGAGGQDNAALVDFVKQYVPENRKLLSDINALSSLASITEAPTLPATSAFLNPYTRAQALEHSGTTGTSPGSLLSLLL